MRKMCRFEIKSRAVLQNDNDVENTPNMFSTKEIPRNAGEVWFYHAANFMFSDLSFFSLDR